MFTTVVEMLSVVDGIFPDNIDCRTNKKIGINKCRSGDGGVGGSPPPHHLHLYLAFNWNYVLGMHNA